MSEIDRILEELGSISARLHELPEDAREERARLKARQAELRAAARETPEAADDPEVLRRVLERLEQLWDELAGQRIDVVKQAGDLAAGNFGFTSDAMAVNRAIDAAGGRAELEGRIRELRERLARLEG